MRPIVANERTHDRESRGRHASCTRPAAHETPELCAAASMSVASARRRCRIVECARRKAARFDERLEFSDRHAVGDLIRVRDVQLACPHEPPNRRYVQREVTRLVKID